MLRADALSAAGTSVTAVNLDPLYAVPIMAAMAVAVPSCRAALRWLKDRDGDKPELDKLPASVSDTIPDSVRSIFEALDDVRGGQATGVLDGELADLMDEPDWGKVNRRLDDAVREWCRECPAGAGNPPDQAEMVRVLLSLIRNVREATYREQFADHYRQIVSVDRPDRSRVDDVFIHLRAERRAEDPSGPDKPEYLDFRGRAPTDTEAMLRQSGNLVILGEPGSGKSTLLRYLAATCAESEADDALLPVFLRLRDYASDQEVLIAESAVAFAEGALQLKMPEGFFDDALSSGRCLVCVDALDEVPAGERYRIVRRVEQLARRYRDSHFIITSRIAGYDENPLDEQTFTRYVVQPMDVNGISAFIGRQFADEPERTQNLKDLLDANPGIKSLVSNQLLMTILKLVYRKGDAGLPLNRAKFYELAVDILVRDEDDEGRRIDGVRLQEHENLLADIARLLHDENRETIGRAELEERAAESLLKYRGKSDNPTRADEDDAFAEAETFIKRSEQRTGLLVEQQPGSGVFRFVHATFREYLAAKDIRDRYRNYDRHSEACWEEIKDHLTDARWREVILLLVGSLDRNFHRYCTYLTGKILAAGDEVIHRPARWQLPTHLQLAADALANQAPISYELQQDIVGRLGCVGKGHNRLFSIRDDNKAVGALGVVRHLPELVNPVLAAIATDPAAYGSTRLRAAENLARMDDTGTAIATLTSIATDPAVDARTRVSAAERLGRLGETDAAIATLTAIATDPAVDARSRMSAAAELERLGETDTAKATLTAIVTDPAVADGDGVSAAERLGRFGETDAAIATLTAIATGPAVAAGDRVSAAERLGRLGRTDTAIATLSTIATDPEVAAGDRVSAAERLGRLGRTDTAIATLSTIATDPEVAARVRVSAAEGVGRFGESDAAIATLSAIATDPAADTSTRVRAAEGLGRLGETDTAIATLSAIATDPAADTSTRVHAAAELERLGETDTAIATLSAIATDPAVDGGTLWYVVEELGSLAGTDAAIATLTAIATDPAVNAGARSYAADELVGFGESDTAIATLSAIATDPAVDAGARSYAAERLGHLGWTDAAIATLSAIATDPAVNAGARVAAARELGRLGRTDTAIATLSTIATDPAVDAWPRVAAAAELERLGETDTAIATLSTIATDPAVAAGDRVYAAAELGFLGETDAAIATLTSIATDPAVAAGDRVYAAERLWRLGWTDAAIATLTSIATDPAVDAGALRYVAEALGRLGGTDTAIATLTSISTDPAVAARTRVSAAAELGRLGRTDTAITTLSAIATDPMVDAGDRRSAVEGLGRLGEDGIAELTAIAKGPVIAEVDRSHVVDALARVVRQPEQSGNSEAAKAALAQLAQDDTVSADVRSRAAWQLGRLGEVQAAIASLTDLVKDPAAPAMEKVRAAGAIQEFGGSTEEPIAAMRAGIADPEIGIRVRIRMAWRMSDLGERDEGIATLAAIANDETVDDINRVDAAWHLGKLDASDLARPALNVLTAVAECVTAEPGPRFQAGKVLADLGVKETAIAALTAVAHSAEADAEDRIDAAKVLANLGDKATAETVLQTIADDRLLSNADREDAREALRKLNEE